MALCKDKCYDPPVNYCEEESESDDELNNEKSIHPPLSSSPLGDNFIHNNLRQKGGMLDVDDTDMDPQAPSRRCQNRRCRRMVPLGEKMYGSLVYSCSDTPAAQKSDESYVKTHRFCKNCADLSYCPAPRCGLKRHHQNYGRTPNVLAD